MPFDLAFLGRLLVGYGFGVVFVYGGVLQFYRAVDEQYENLSFSGFNPLFSAVRLTDDTTVLRVFWLLGGPFCFLFGLGYLGVVTWLLVT